MRCYYKILSTITLFCALSFTLSAQTDIFKKKEDLKDLNSKKLLVVIENNALSNLALKSAVEKNWELSKYEFITPAEFEKFMGDTSYYFLIKVKGIFKKEREAGMEFISFLKGGPKTVDGVADMKEILSLPYGAIGGDDSEMSDFLEAYVKIIQSHALRIQKKKIAATLGISWYSNRLSDIKGKYLYMSETDLAEDIDKSSVEEMFNGNGCVCNSEVISEVLNDNRPNSLVTISVAPNIPQQGSYCYKMVLSADSYELFYYRKQKITSGNPKGFLMEDIKKIAVPLAFEK